jgi:hypothetical protein
MANKTAIERPTSGQQTANNKNDKKEKNEKNVRENAELSFEDLVAHFEPLFPHLNVRGSLSKMVFEEKWAPTISNGNYWLSQERGFRKNKPKRKTSAPEYSYSQPQVQPGQKKEQFIPGTPECNAAWEQVKNELLGPRAEEAA